MEMKRIFIVIAIMLTSYFLQFCAENKPPSVGSFYQGGIVLSYNDSTHSGLVISASDLNSNLTWLEGKMVCDTIKILGFDDWRMPSKEELLLCYKVLKMNKNTEFLKTPYWASQEGKPGYFAWFVDFSNGSAYESNENNVAQIRAIRNFRL